jgi:hypothetical protein
MKTPKVGEHWISVHRKEEEIVAAAIIEILSSSGRVEFVYIFQMVEENFSWEIVDFVKNFRHLENDEYEKLVEEEAIRYIIE